MHFTLSCPFTQELKIDQSLAHNGCCLTVVKISGEEYTVTAINETLEKNESRKSRNRKLGKSRAMYDNEWQARWSYSTRTRR